MNNSLLANDDIERLLGELPGSSSLADLNFGLSPQLCLGTAPLIDWLDTHRAELEDRHYHQLHAVIMTFDGLARVTPLIPAVQQSLLDLFIPACDLILEESLVDEDGQQIHPLLVYMQHTAMAVFGVQGEQSPVAKLVLANIQQAHSLMELQGVDFIALSLSLKQSVDSLDQRAAKIVNRLSEKEQGKAMALQAQRSVEQVYNRLFGGKYLPQTWLDLLSGPWLDSMRLSYLCHGVDSREWQRGQRYAELLVRVVVYRNDESKRKAFFNTVDLLLNSTEKVFLSLREQPQELEGVQSSLELCVEQMVRGDELALQRVETLELVEPARTELALNTQSTLAVEALQLNDWLQLADYGLCRLAVILCGAQQFVFVNRQGMRVCELSFTQLSIGLQHGEYSLMGGAQDIAEQFAQLFAELQYLIKGYKNPSGTQRRHLDVREAQAEEVLQQERRSILDEARSHARRRSLLKQRLQAHREAQELRRAAVLAASEREARQQRIKAEELAAAQAAHEEGLRQAGEKREQAQRCKSAQDQAANLQKGAWLDWNPQGGERQRLKLVVIHRSSGECVFIDRRGVKKLVLTRELLAEALVSAELVVVDSGEAHDDAMQKLLGAIRQDRGKS